MEGYIFYVNTIHMRRYTYTINQDFFKKNCSNDLKFKNKISIYINEYYMSFKGSKHDT